MINERNLHASCRRDTVRYRRQHRPLSDFPSRCQFTAGNFRKTQIILRMLTVSMLVLCNWVIGAGVFPTIFAAWSLFCILRIFVERKLNREILLGSVLLLFLRWSSRRASPEPESGRESRESFVCLLKACSCKKRTQQRIFRKPQPHNRIPPRESNTFTYSFRQFEMENENKSENNGKEWSPCELAVRKLIWINPTITASNSMHERFGCN